MGFHSRAIGCPSHPPTATPGQCPGMMGPHPDNAGTSRRQSTASALGTQCRPGNDNKYLFFPKGGHVPHRAAGSEGSGVTATGGRRRRSAGNRPTMEHGAAAPHRRDTLCVLCRLPVPHAMAQWALSSLSCISSWYTRSKRAFCGGEKWERQSPTTPAGGQRWHRAQGPPLCPRPCPVPPSPLRMKRPWLWSMISRGIRV